MRDRLSMLTPSKIEKKGKVSQEEQIVNLARLQIYKFLSRAFLCPEVEFYSLIKEEAFAENLSTWFQCLPNFRKGNGYGKALSSINSTLENLSLEEFQSEYRRIFGHTITPDCSPYETEYAKSNIFQQSQNMGDIGGFYRAFGLEVSDAAKERVDHVSIELEFMYFLIFKENYALMQNRRADSEVCRDAQKKFLNDHLGTWIPLFTNLLCRKARSGFYKVLASLTGDFLRLETELFNIRPEEFTELGSSFVQDGNEICNSCMKT